MSEASEIEMVRKAYSLGIDPIHATDAAIYADLTLAEIGEEWQVCPMELLAALSKAFPSNINGKLPSRHDGESLAQYMRRTLSR